VLVVSDDAFNAGLVMTVPLTSKLVKLMPMPAHIRVDLPEGGLKKTRATRALDTFRAIRSRTPP
jgi:mRNA-degrading endonuclease toxin of MazEF toxin-antitoxin module